MPDSVSAVHNITNPTRDVDSEFEGAQEGKIREIVMDNIDSEHLVCSNFQYMMFAPFCFSFLRCAAVSTDLSYCNTQNFAPC